MARHRYDEPGRRLRNVPPSRCVDEDRLYSDEERRFLVAVDRWKRKARCPHPTLIQVLDVLRGLGWRPPKREGR